MFGSEILEVAIGLIFVFLHVSVMCSAIREGIESWLKTRAAYLERGIRELLHDVAAEPGGLARAFYAHPLIHSLHAYAAPCWQRATGSVAAWSSGESRTCRPTSSRSSTT